MFRPLFFTGVHHPSIARHLDRAMVSLNALESRKADFEVREWILDSGAFTRIFRRKGHLPVRDYARQARRWAECGQLQAVVQQDYMCEPAMLDITGMTVEEHQRLTTQNYHALRQELPDLPIMAVLQGWEPEDYRVHLSQIEPYLEEGAWVGVGSVCKRQGRPAAVSAILTAILRDRPDLRLHGFGVKTTALQHQDIAARFFSVDSMTWSYAGRRLEPKRTHDPAYCVEWTDNVNSLPVNPSQAALL